MGWKSKIVGHGQEPASQLLANPFNHRRHPDKQRKAVAASIREIGFVKSVIVNRTTGHVIDGHERIMQALAQGDDTMVDVEYVELSEEKEKLALLILDKTSELATVDNASLEALVGDVQTAEQDLADLITEMSQEAGLLDGPGAGEVTEDEVPEPPVDPITKPGDLWILGEHRLLCGDSTKAEDVERLMAGAKAEAVVTDPPYGIGSLMHGGTWATKQDRQFSMMREWDATTSQKFFDMIEAMGIPSVVWGGNYFSTPPSRCWLVWDKPEFPTMSSAELAWTNMDKNAKRIECPRAHQADGAKEHATQKPVRVMSWSLEFVPDGLVYDPFLGSGTTLIAAEQLGRKCYGMEISPQYCDVIVKRWETLTGKKAILEKSV
jgi:DNA modification methylase